MVQFINPQRRAPVVDAAGRPLSPCSPGKARQLLESGKAKPYPHPDGFAIQLVDKIIPPEDLCIPEPQAPQAESRPG